MTYTEVIVGATYSIGRCLTLFRCPSFVWRSSSTDYTHQATIPPTESGAFPYEANLTPRTSLDDAHENAVTGCANYHTNVILGIFIIIDYKN